MNFPPRLIRVRDAPAYLGMDRVEFNKSVRPYLTEVRIGTQGKAFDRYELDAWVDWYKDTVGKPPKIDSEALGAQDYERSERPVPRKGGNDLWGVRRSAAYIKGTVSGTSTSASADTADFTKALEREIGKMRSNT
jgi:hypothetical protein